MNHPSPYTLLRGANGFHAPTTFDPPRPSAWTDSQTLAMRWQDLQQRPSSSDAPSPPGTEDDAASGGPRMRAPAPMHPPIAYPTGTQTYGSPAAPVRQRHPYYDAIIEQHKSAAEKAVFVPAELE